MKTTKKEIVSTLRTLDATKIFRIAKLNGVDVSTKARVYDFIRENAPTIKIYKSAYKIAFCANDYKLTRQDYKKVSMPIKDAISFAKSQKNIKETNYLKILIEGNKNIYWASPAYGHSDYNKSIAFENNEKNRRISQLINKFINN